MGAKKYEPYKPDFFGSGSGFDMGVSNPMGTPKRTHTGKAHQLQFHSVEKELPKQKFHLVDQEHRKQEYHSGK